MGDENQPWASVKAASACHCLVISLAVATHSYYHSVRVSTGVGDTIGKQYILAVEAAHVAIKVS